MGPGSSGPAYYTGSYNTFRHYPGAASTEKEEEFDMPVRLETTVSKITTIPNKVNSSLVSEFYHYLKNIDASERHQNNSLKSIIVHSHYLGPNTTFYDM